MLFIYFADVPLDYANILALLCLRKGLSLITGKYTVELLV